MQQLILKIYKKIFLVLTNGYRNDNIKPEVKKGGKQVRKYLRKKQKKDDNPTKLAIVLGILLIIEKVLDIIFKILDKLGL